jgi:hypothetical protein
MRLLVLLVFALSACSLPQVRCDRHLQPINAPAVKEPAAQSAAPDPAGQVLAASIEGTP